MSTSDCFLMPTSGYTGLSSAPLSGTGIAPQIVQTLRDYKKELPEAFLAHVLRKKPAELDIDLRRLAERDVVRRAGGKVRLSD